MDEVSVEIAASPAKVWELVANFDNMGRWSPELVSCKWLDGATGPAVGARFKGTNRHGLARWSTKSVITKAEEALAIEWQVDESGMLWGYRFEPTAEGGTRVTEYREKTRDVPLYVKLVQRSGLIGRDREALMLDGMRETLDRIKKAAES